MITKRFAADKKIKSTSGLHTIDANRQESRPRRKEKVKWRQQQQTAEWKKRKFRKIAKYKIYKTTKWLNTQQRPRQTATTERAKERYERAALHSLIIMQLHLSMLVKRVRPELLVLSPPPPHPPHRSPLELFSRHRARSPQRVQETNLKIIHRYMNWKCSKKISFFHLRCCFFFTSACLKTKQTKNRKKKSLMRKN